jgi:predicted MFS family arabinose efflux permease
VLALAGFVLVERRTREPLLPLDLFANRIVAVTSAAGCLAGIVLFGSIVFLPLFLQVAKGMSATSSGLLLMPLMVGVLVASIVSGRLVTRTGRYKPFPIVGTALMAVAFWLLSLLRATTPAPLIIGEMVLLGIGIGPLMQVLVLASQNAVPQRHLGLVTSLAQFFRELGGTFGVALFGAIFSARLGVELARRLPGRGGLGAGALEVTPRGSPAGLRSLPPAVHHAIVEAVARSVGIVFHWAVPFAVAAFLLTLGLRELPLRDGSEPAASSRHGPTG